MSVKDTYQQLLPWGRFLISFALFQKDERERQVLYVSVSSFVFLSRYWVIITWSLDLHRKEVAFYKVTSAIHMATHFVLSVSQRRSEEPSKKLKLTVCPVNLHREAGRRTIFRPVSYLLWHFPFSACAWNTHSQLVARNTCRPGAGKAWTCALKIRSIAREISPSC